MFTNLHELITQMPDEKACREYLIKERWNGIIICPYCGLNEGKVYVIEGGKRFKCGRKECYKKFSVTVGTIFEASNIPLKKWLMAIYVLTAHKKGISSYQLARDIGCTQKTAWFMLHRIREMMKGTNERLSSPVQVDETYMGRKYRSDYVGLSPEQIDYNLKHPTRSKGAVLAMGEPEGKVKAVVIKEVKAANVWQEINTHINYLSEIHTDESALYADKNEMQPYFRKSVNHSKREWARDGISTNRVENFFGVMKRGIHGIYHQVSVKHLQAYCNEYAYRYNSRDIKDYQRFVATIGNIQGRLTYKALVNK